MKLIFRVGYFLQVIFRRMGRSKYRTCIRGYFFDSGQYRTDDTAVKFMNNHSNGISLLLRKANVHWIRMNIPAFPPGQRSSSLFLRFQAVLQAPANRGDRDI
jgi:hypothetical protein